MQFKLLVVNNRNPSKWAIVNSLWLVRIIIIIIFIFSHCILHSNAINVINTSKVL